MTDSQNRPIVAAFWMLGSILGFTALAISGRALGGTLDTFEMMLYRSAIGLVVVLIIAALSGRLRDIGTEALGLHFIRNIIHFAGQNLWLYALALIPLAQLFALEFSYPILVALLAPLILGERLTRLRISIALVGFLGILIVARPFGAGALSPGLIAALLCALGFAGAALATKRLTRRVSITAILFWLALMQTFFGLIVAGHDGAIALPEVSDLPWVVLMGAAGIGAHLSLTKALSLAPASVVTPIDFMRLPIIAVIGMLFYGEPLDLWVLVGGAVIFAANWVNILVESRGPKGTLRSE
jgi:drug/metabolite transporter (DMT)-like permease